MRLTISREGLCSRFGSMRCERCFPKVVKMEKEGSCVLEQIDDGLNVVTLIIVEDGAQMGYVVPLTKMIPLFGESWEMMMSSIAPYRTF